MKTKARPRSPRRKPVYFTLNSGYEKRIRGVEAAFCRPRAELAREWTQEKLDLMDFPCLEFRSSSRGQFAIVRGTRLAVWQMALLARTLGWGQELAADLEISPDALHSALGYYERHRAEVEALIEANQAIGFEELKRAFPKLRRLD